MTAEVPLFAIERSEFAELDGMSVRWTPAKVSAPELLMVNEDLTAELGLDIDHLRSPAGVEALAGHEVADGAVPVAQAYAGHQFGSYSPRLGDGRAVLLGELRDVHGVRRDLHLKGSGRTPFARGGDGLAAVGPMLREYVMGEAMHALGIPTTRALAVVATGDQVARDTMLPGAVLARVASSHLRVGSFQYAASLGDPKVLRGLADHAIARHHPGALEADHRYLALFESVVTTQASLVARWMLVGFVHGVLNTDNVTISGETIDFGPCAFMEAFDPATVFSSIDHAGRYAYGNQPQITQWNLARLAEAVLPLLDADTDRAVAMATEVLQTFGGRFHAVWTEGMRAKLGLPVPGTDDSPAAVDDGAAHDGLVDDLLAMMGEQRVEFTSCFRALSSVARGDPNRARALFADPDAFDGWSARWLDALSRDERPLESIATSMDRVNPVYVARNHLVEEALDAATAGDLVPVQKLVDVLARPFDERAGLDRYAEPAPADFGRYVTFCGT